MRLIQMERSRTLPYTGRITVEIGQKVSPNTTVAILDYVPGTIYRVKVTKVLSLPNDQLEEVLLVSVGDHVSKGQIIAANHVLYRPSVCMSPIDGVVGFLSKQLGQLYIRDTIPLDNDAEDDMVFDLSKLYPDKSKRLIERGILVKIGDKISPNQIIAQFGMKKYVVCYSYGRVKSIDNLKITITSKKINSKLKAYLPGEVTEIMGQDGVVIRGNVHHIQGLYGIGGERQGYLRIVGDIKHSLSPEDVTQADQGKILFVADGVKLSALRKANDVGVGAVITSTMPYADVKAYAGGGFIPGITGNENIRTGLMLLNGFLPLALEAKIFQFIQQYAGNWVSMRGTTHIRAGALRPELILPQKTAAHPIEEDHHDILRVGSMVKVLCSGRLHGKTGIIRAIINKPMPLPSHIKALIASVEIDGQIYRLPLTNLAFH